MSEKIEIVLVDETGGQSQPPASSPNSPTPTPTPTPTPAASTPTPTPAASTPTPATPAPGTQTPPSLPGAGAGAPTPNLPNQTAGSVTWVDRLGKVFDRVFSRQMGRPFRQLHKAILQVIRAPMQIVNKGMQILRNPANALGALAGGVGQQATNLKLLRYELFAARQRSKMIRLLKRMAPQSSNQSGGGFLNRTWKRITDLFRRNQSGGKPKAGGQPVGKAGSGTAARGVAGGAGGGAVARGVAGGAGGAGGGAMAGAGRAAMGAVQAGSKLLTNPVGLIVAAVIAAFVGLAAATYGLIKVFKHNEQELLSVSGEIRGALSEREAGRVQLRVERNERIGKETAQITRAWTRFEEMSYELWTDIFELLSQFAPFLEFLIDLMTALLASFRVALKQIMIIIQLLDYMIIPFIELVPGTIKGAVAEFGESVVDAFQAWQNVFQNNSTPAGTPGFFGSNPHQNQSRPINPALFNPGLPQGPNRI